MPLIVTPRQLSQRAEFYHQLNALTTAGIGLLQALEMIRNNPPSRAFRPLAAQLLEKINEGATLAESMQSTGRWLPTFDLALLQAGEQSGRLPESFRLLSGYYNERAQLARQVIDDLLYPAFVLHFAILIFPPSQLVQLFNTGNPFSFLGAKLATVAPAYALIFVFLIAGQGNRGEAWRAGIERVVHFIPIIGRARRNLALARLSVALEALISAGVSIVEAWPLAAAASGSPALRRAVDRWAGPLQSGQTPAELVSASAEFPELFANLYQTGEISGKLDETLGRLHRYHQEEGSRKLRLFAQWSVKLIYIGILIAVAFQIVGFWTRYYGGILGGTEF